MIIIIAITIIIIIKNPTKKQTLKYNDLKTSFFFFMGELYESKKKKHDLKDL